MTTYLSPSTKGYREVSKETENVSENQGNSSNFLTPNQSPNSILDGASLNSINIFKDGEIFLQKSVRRCNGVLLQGPRRLLRICMCVCLIPALLISVPLYVRMILYPPFHYMMAPTDQRLLDQTSSSIWCQGQEVHMNGSFNAFLLSKTPRTKRHFSTHTMLQHITLKDDIKEYWGFFFQKGSIVSINLCNRYDGGILMIMRGVHNLRKCAWIGEEDSAEQDEDHKDTSNESGHSSEVTHQFPIINGEILIEVESKGSLSSTGPRMKSTEKAINLTSEERKEELDYYIQKVLKLSKNRKEILRGLINQKPNLKFKGDKKLQLNSRKTVKNKKKKSSKNDRLERVKRYLEDNSENKGEIDVMEQQQQSIRENIYSNIWNSSYEVSNQTREQYLKLFRLPTGLTYERGLFNQTTPHDTSDEEHRSSFSSSEEALTKCEGLIGMLPLYPSRTCHGFNDSHTNKVKYRIPTTGTYYFVFSSDNEVFDSEMYLNMTLERVVFDTEAAKETCLNKTDCSFGFSFWSHDQAVVEVPEGNWNAAYAMEIKCQPRVAVYLFLFFLIPILILFCALH